MEVWQQQLLHLLLPYSALALVRRLLLSTDTTGPSSYLLCLKITAQTEILHEPWSGKEKVKVYRHKASSGATQIIENGHPTLLYFIRQTVKGN